MIERLHILIDIIGFCVFAIIAVCVIRDRMYKSTDIAECVFICLLAIADILLMIATSPFIS